MLWEFLGSLELGPESRNLRMKWRLTQVSEWAELMMEEFNPEYTVSKYEIKC